MTSSNVSNLLVQVSQIGMSSASEKMAVSKDKGLFENTLKNVAGSGNPVEIKQADPKLNEKPEEKPFDSSPNQAKVGVERPDNGNPSDTTEVVDKVEKIADEIKDVIKDELDITDEELEEAMETLGLTVLDLFDPQMLAQLVTEITGEADSVSLVVDDSFKIILDEVSKLTDQLFKDLKMTFEDIKEIVLPAITEENFEIPTEDIKVHVPLEETPELVEKPDDKVQVIKPDEAQEVQVVSDKQAVPEEVIKPDTINKPEAETSVELKPQVDDNNDSSKQEFDFTKNAKTAQENPRVNHEAVVRNDGVIFGQQTNEIQFSVEQELVTLPTGETVKAESIVNQLVEQAKVLTDSESTTMEITLNPEGLGKIFMEVTQKGDQITAKIFTENDAVKQALENQMANLRLELNQNSTKVTSIEVSVGTHEFERNLEQNQRDDSRREEQMQEQAPKRRSSINLNSLDELSGVMSEEDMLIAQMMRDNGNTLDFQA